MQTKRVFLDANAVITSVEGPAVSDAALRDHIAETVGARPAYIVSDLVRMECRVKPLRASNDVLLTTYDNLFVSPGMSVVGLTASVCDRAAAIRAEYGFRTPDALHLAAAVEAECDAFVTADRQLAQFTGIHVAVYDPSPEAPDEPDSS